MTFLFARELWPHAGVAQIVERHLVTAAFVIIVGNAGCDAPSRPQSAVEKRDSAGHSIIENHSPAWADAVSWHTASEPEVVIGGDASGDSAHLIWDVTGAVRLIDGRLAVLSGQHRKLFVFDSSGELSKVIGQAGRGPGEFRYPQHLQYFPGDTLVVWDAQYGPISYFDTTGVLLRERHIDLGRVMAEIGRGSRTEMLTPLRDGSFVAHVGRGGRERRPTEGELQRPPMGYVRIDTNHVAFPLGWYEGVEHALVDLGPLTLPAIHLFPVRSSIAAGGEPLRIYISNGDQDVVHQFSPAGTLIRVVRRVVEPIGITREERRAAMERYYDLNARNQRGRQTMAELMRAVPEQSSYPPIGDLIVDTQGFLWSKDKPGQWSVFTPEGRWLGRLSVPLWRVLWISDELILGVNRDALERERVEGYHLTRFDNLK